MPPPNRGLVGHRLQSYARVCPAGPAREKRNGHAMTEQRDRVRAIVNDILIPPQIPPQRPCRRLWHSVASALAGCILALVAMASIEPTAAQRVQIDRVMVEALVAYVAEVEGVPRRRLRAELTTALGVGSLDDLDISNLHTAICELRRRLTVNDDLVAWNATLC